MSTDINPGAARRFDELDAKVEAKLSQLEEKADRLEALLLELTARMAEVSA